MKVFAVNTDFMRKSFKPRLIVTISLSFINYAENVKIIIIIIIM